MAQIASCPCPRCETGALRPHDDGVFCVNCGTVYYASRPSAPANLRSVARDRGVRAVA